MDEKLGRSLADRRLRVRIAEMMFGYPLGRPPVEFDVMNEAGALMEKARAQVSAARPLVREKVVVIADVVIETSPKPCQRTNEEFKPRRVGVDKKLAAVRVGGKTEDVRNGDFRGVFVVHWLSRHLQRGPRPVTLEGGAKLSLV